MGIVQRGNVTQVEVSLLLVVFGSSSVAYTQVDLVVAAVEPVVVADMMQPCRWYITLKFLVEMLVVLLLAEPLMELVAVVLVLWVNNSSGGPGSGRICWCRW